MRYPAFSYHLQWAIARKMTVKDFAARLGFRHTFTVMRWINGDTIPDVTDLYAISTVLDADPVEMLAVWSSEVAPQYEAIVKAEILEPRGSKAKLQSDSDIHNFRILVPMGR